MKDVKFSRYDTADYLKTEADIAAYLEAVEEDGDATLIMDAQEIVARTRSMNDERPRRRMAAANAVACKMAATKRFDPPPANEADAWVSGIYDEEDVAGRVISPGRPVWYRKDLVEEWHRLRLADEGES